MKYLYKLSMFVIFLAISNITVASNGIKKDTVSVLVSIFDDLSYKWDMVAENLEKYQGLGSFCIEKEYREEVLNLLSDVHHFDSLIYTKLTHISNKGHNLEIRKTLKQIEELESEFSIKEFKVFLNQECKERKIIERSRNSLKADIGQNGYDGQKELIENTLYRYIHHVTYLVDHIRKHVHHLHLEKES